MRANAPTRSRTDTCVHRASDPLPARALLPEACGKLERTAACRRRPWASLCRAARARVMTMLSFPTSRPRREGLRVHTYLLFVLLGMRQHGGHVEHDLVPLVHGVHRAYPRGVVCKTQAHVSRVRGVLGPEGDGLYVRTRAVEPRVATAPQLILDHPPRGSSIKGPAHAGDTSSSPSELACCLMHASPHGGGGREKSGPTRRACCRSLPSGYCWCTGQN